MIYLREISRRPGVRKSGYPHDAGVLSHLGTLSLRHSVTILCGDNGSGKTTLLSLIAALVNARVVGDTGVGREKCSCFALLPGATCL